MTALTRWVLHHRKRLLVAWISLVVVSGALASGLTELLTNRFTLPGTDTEKTETILEEHFGQKSTGSFTLVVETDGPAAQVVPQVRRAAERASAAMPTSRVVATQPVSAHVVSAQIVSELEPADAKGYTDDMREAAGEIPGAQVYLTGQAAIEHDLDPVFAEDLKVGELYIAIPAALLLLVAVFGTAAFLVPFMFAAAAIPVTLAIIWGFANFMELTTYLQNMVMLIGLAIAVDYSLLVVYRFRDELHRGGSGRTRSYAR